MNTKEKLQDSKRKVLHSIKCVNSLIRIMVGSHLGSISSSLCGHTSNDLVIYVQQKI